MIKNLTKNASNPKGFWGNLMIKKMNRGHAFLTDWAFEKMQIQSSDTLLDVGCGGGKAMKKLLKLAPSGKVYGIDHSDLAVEQSKKQNKSEVKASRAFVKRADVSKLTFEDNKFDKITAVETIYFWPDLLAGFLEVKRVLKEGGTFCVVCDMWKKDDDDTAKYEQVSEFLKDMYIPVISELEKLLLKAGYKDIKVHTQEEKRWLAILAKK